MGYYGQFCSIRQDSCELKSNCDQVVNDCHLEGGGSPCAANSQCVDQLCPLDYTGRLCDTRIDHCVGVVCIGNKTLCVDEVNSFRCDCKEGFTGENCDLPSKSARRNSNSCFSQSKSIRKTTTT